MGEQIQLYSPQALLKLVPYYHEKKTDGTLMFFRMNNARVFEACRSARLKFKQFTSTPSFQNQFLSQFFTENGTVFLFQKYNQASLYAMIEIARIIIQSLFRKVSQQGGKYAKSRRQKRKQKKTRKVQGYTLWSFLRFAQKGGDGNLILRTQNPLLKQDSAAIQTFVKKVPYNGFIGITNTEYLTQLLFQRALTPEQQAFLKKNINELICVGLIFDFVQHMVPEYFVLQIEKTSQLALQEGGGAIGKYLKTALVALLSLTSVPVTEVSTSFSQAMTAEEVVKTDIALVTPTLTNSGQMLNLYESGVDTAVSDAFSKELSIVPVDIFYGEILSFCHMSKPIPQPPIGVKTGYLDSEFVTLTHIIHSISARNQTAGEFAFTIVRDDETGVLRPNATISTEFKRGSTIIKMSSMNNVKEPENTVMTWHLHPWELDRRINSHFSQADFKFMVLQTITSGIPYQAAHAPEGLYVYSLQKSTLTALYLLSGPGITWKAIGDWIVTSQVLIDKEFIGLLGCEDIRTRQITSFENMGTVPFITEATNTVPSQTISIPFGIEIRFYNQQDLMKGTPISFEYVDLWKSPGSYKFQRMPAVPGMTGAETWDLIKSEAYSTNAARQQGVNYGGLPGLQAMPSGFDTISFEEITRHHGVDIEPLVTEVLANPKKFLQFQKAVNRYILRKGMTPAQIESHFQDIMDYGLNPTSGTSSAAAPAVFPWLVGLVGLAAAIQIINSLKNDEENKNN